MASKKQSISHLISNQQSLVEDQFQNLRDVVIRNRERDASLASILVTAESHGDGASMVSINLAMALAKEGETRVVLVDGDRRRPILNTAFDLGEVEGLAEVLKGDVDLDSALRITLEPPKIALLPYGLDTEQPARFGQEKMAEVMDVLRERFDLVIFNSSPINKYSETVALAAHSDTAVLVMQAEVTKWDGMERCKAVLEKAGVPILGVVMNRRRYYIPHFLFKRLFV
jgi:capsular exopolysaccharide synthesis family protein